MVSLELEARLDNLLATAQKETADIDLFAPIPDKNECPMCMIPLLPADKDTTFMYCCGKCVCNGCVYKYLFTMMENGVKRRDELGKCAFCRQTAPNNLVKALKKLMKKNIPRAFAKMADKYEQGDDGMIQSNTKALEMYICAAEPGNAKSYGCIGWYYYKGIVVEQDISKYLEFTEVAAKKGSYAAHLVLAGYHDNAGSVQWSNEHLKVVASAGDQNSMDDLMKAYKNKEISKEELTQTLRAFQASRDKLKSNDRENARLLEESREKGVAPPAHLFK